MSGLTIPGGPSFIGFPQPPDVPCDPTGEGWRGPPGPIGPPGPVGPQGVPGVPGSGAVNSVAGKVGDVVLVHTDITDWSTAVGQGITIAAGTGIAVSSVSPTTTVALANTPARTILGNGTGSTAAPTPLSVGANLAIASGALDLAAINPGPGKVGSLIGVLGTVSAIPQPLVLDPNNFIVGTPGTISTSGTVSTINVSSNNGYQLNGQVIINSNTTTHSLWFGANAGNGTLATGNFSLFLGEQSGQWTTSGGELTFVGYLAGSQNITGSFNTAVGENAFGHSQYDQGNCFIGNDAGRNFGGSASNTVIGRSANHDGSRGKNTFIGDGTGFGSGYSVTLGGSVTPADTMNIVFTSTGATFTGYIAGNILTVTAMTSGVLYYGHRLLTGGASVGTTLISPGVGTGAGGAGTYMVNNSQVVGSAGSPVTFTSGAFATQTLAVSMAGLSTLAQAATAVAAAFTANTALFSNGLRGCYVVNGGTVVNFGMIGGNNSYDSCTISYTQGANTETLAITNGQDGSDGNSIGIGYQTMRNYTASSYVGNISVGNAGMQYLTTAQNNIGIGVNNIQFLTTGQDNIGIGSNVLTVLTTGLQNLSIGSNAGGSITTTSGNVFVGYRAGWKSVTGANNTVLGNGAFAGATAGIANVVIGQGAWTGAGTGNSNVIIGSGAFQSQAAAAGSHVYVGTNAGNTYTSGEAAAPNVVIGTSAGSGAAGAYNQSVIIGARAGQALVSGTGITALGYQAGKTLTTAAGSNTLVGANVASTTLATGTGNILIGVDVNTDTAAAGTSNTLLVRGAGGSAVPAIFASAINAALPKVAVGAGGGAAAPVAGTDILAGMFMLWKNSTDSTAKFYYNDAGTLKSVALT